MPMQAIAIKGLTMLYPNGRGIREISLDVQEGEIFGFLGPNGAGKSTTIRTLMGFLRPSAGEARVLGHDVVRESVAVRREVGYLPSEIALYDGLTGEQNVAFALKVRGGGGPDRARELARHLEVDLGHRVKTLSRGQRQKVAITVALAHDPRVLILDEPTTGLDPLAQEVFHALVRGEVARGKTLFMSSHILSEVEELCQRVALVRDGRIVTTDTVASLKRQRVKRVRVEFRAAVPALGDLPGVTDLKLDGRRARFTLVGALDPLLGRLATHPVVDLSVQDPSLEEVFRAFYAGVQAGGEEAGK